MRRCSLRLAVCLLVAFAARGADLSLYSGNYELPSGDLIAIAEWELSPSIPRVLAFTNLQTGRFGVLTSAAENEFTLNRGILAGEVEQTIRFEALDGRVRALRFGSQRASRVADRSEAVTIQSGQAKLGGTLYLPSGKGPFPAIVLVPAGALHRTATATFPNFFLSQGIAVLVYDRRKETEPFETYARDAIAAVEELRRRDVIDGKRVGLWGHSQGGWLSLMAASMSDSVAFVINSAGMLVPAWQQEMYRLSAEAMADGVDPRDASAAVAYAAELMHVAQTGNGWEGLKSKIDEAGSAAWVDRVFRPESLEELQRFWKNDFSFDPRSYAGGVQQPVLALFGGLDKSTPIESAANLIHARRGRPGLTVKIFPTANHALLESKTGGNSEIPTLTRFVPGLFEEMRRWLKETVRGPSSGLRPPSPR